MNYKLNIESNQQKKISTFAAVKKLWPLFDGEHRSLIIAFMAILVNAGVNLLGPFIIGHTVDTYVLTKITAAL